MSESIQPSSASRMYGKVWSRSTEMYWGDPVCTCCWAKSLCSPHKHCFRVLPFLFQPWPPLLFHELCLNTLPQTLCAVNWCKPDPAVCLTCCALISNRETEQRAGDCWCGKPLHSAPSEQEHSVLQSSLYPLIPERECPHSYLFQEKKFIFSVGVNLSGVNLACFRF